MLLYVILAFIKVAGRLLSAFFIQIIQSKISTILLKLNHQHLPDLRYKKVKKIFYVRKPCHYWLWWKSDGFFADKAYF